MCFFPFAFFFPSFTLPLSLAFFVNKKNMYTHPSRQHQYYTAALKGVTTTEMPPLQAASRHRGSESLTPRTSVRSRKERQQTRMDGDDEPWDSDSELDQVHVREATRVYRPVATVKSTPYYSTLIEPTMALGDQWPKHSPRGFQKVIPGQKRKVPVVHHPPDQQQQPLYALTVNIAETFQKHNPDYRFDGSRNNPKRVLTKPSKPAMNDGFDNENCDYILRVNEILGDEKDYQYRVIDLLGQGTFGQVVKCERICTGQLYSVKVIKNKRAYRTQSRLEVEILKQLSQKLGPDDGDHILQLQHTFNHKNHLCLVFELLSFNLYELIKQNGFKGLSLNLVRVFALQLLDSLILLKKARIIHCDLKPENVLLKSVKSPTIKVIDFGSACHESSHVYTYIQSRFYRSPEILLGLPYTSAIDMWSLGCIVAELFIGIPLFPGSSEYNQLFRITEMLGHPPQDMLDQGKSTQQFYNREEVGGKRVYKMKSREQYGKEQRKNELPGKRYLAQTELPALILEYNSKSSSRTNAAPNPVVDEQVRQRDLQMRHALINFLEGLLQLNPVKRWSPMQARYHPFVTGEPYLEPYNPEKHMKSAMQSQKPPTPPTQDPSESAVDGSMESTLRSLEAAAIAVGAKRQTKFIEGDTIAPTPTRARAQSLGIPTAPTQIQKLAQDIKTNPIDEIQSTNNKNGRHIRPHNEASIIASPTKLHRHARSQGNLIGLLPPEAPLRDQQKSDSNSSAEKHTVFDGPPDSASRKVKIAPMLRVRYGSRDSLRMPDEVHAKRNGSKNDLQESASSSRSDGEDWLEQSRPITGRLAHAGEAAGGLLMMRQQEKGAGHMSLPTASSLPNGSKRVAQALKRRTMGGTANM
ncbi:kinase-like domain-containing protein [Fennellomyces sp. T-0311]|nr:kinase-like domain-containing protein [Fennellomyces sp. T-0311]